MIRTVRSVARLLPTPARALIRRALQALPIRVPLGPQPKRLTLEKLTALGDKGVVVFFAPEASIVQHYVAHCLIAKTLQERGHCVLIIRCFDVYPRCVVMDSVNFAGDADAGARRGICTSCVNAANSMAGEYGLNVLDLKDLVDDAMLHEIDRLTDDLPENLLTFEFEGVRFGKFCAAMAAVTFKTTDFTGADPAVRALLIKYISGALISYRAMQRLVKNVNVIRVVHHTQYAILLAAALAARRAKVPTTNMAHATVRAIDRRRIVFMAEILAIATFRHELSVWPQWRDLALPPAAVRDIGDDGVYRMSSNSIFIYSPIHTGSLDNLFKKLNLRPDRKLLVAFTSSLDEIAANNHYLESVGLAPFPERQPFRDQIEWLHALIERVEPSSDLQLVIRVHPREGANRRDPLQSTHLGLLRQQFSQPYENVRIVWPEDPISSYDLMELAEVGLSAWSFTALEMARLGVPTVVAFDLHTPYPIGDVVRWKETREGYFDCLEQALQTGPSLDPILFAYRWSYLRFLGCSINLDDVVPNSEFGGLPRYKTPRAAADIESVLIGGRSALDVNRDALLANQGPQANAVEHDALMHQLRRSIWYLCFGEDRDEDYRLFYSRSALASVPDGYDAAVIDDGESIELRAAGRSTSRRSHMVRRLAKLAAVNHAERVQ